jgi:hypothetical protein
MVLVANPAIKAAHEQQLIDGKCTKPGFAGGGT